MYNFYFMYLNFEKVEPNNTSDLSVSRQVVREERFKNAAGKNMIRKIVMKTVRKRL